MRSAAFVGPEMLRTLAIRGERYMNAADLAASLGKKPSGGHWNPGVAVLRNNRLIEADGRRYRVAELFRVMSGGIKGKFRADTFIPISGLCSGLR